MGEGGGQQTLRMMLTTQLLPTCRAQRLVPGKLCREPFSRVKVLGGSSRGRGLGEPSRRRSWGVLFQGQLLGGLFGGKALGDPLHGVSLGGLLQRAGIGGTPLGKPFEEPFSGQWPWESLFREEVLGSPLQREGLLGVLFWAKGSVRPPHPAASSAACEAGPHFLRAEPRK